MPNAQCPKAMFNAQQEQFLMSDDVLGNLPMFDSRAGALTLDIAHCTLHIDIEH
jgi:hypothetical protein